MTLPAINIATSSARALATHGAMRGIWRILTNKWIGRGAVGYSVYDLFDSDTEWDNEIQNFMPFSTEDQREVAKALMSGTLEDIASGEILNFEQNLKQIQDGEANQLFIIQQVYPPKDSEDTYSLTYRPFSRSSVKKSGERKQYKK
mgnify:CR=1 FL=1